MRCHGGRLCLTDRFPHTAVTAWQWHNANGFAMTHREQIGVGRSEGPFEGAGDLGRTAVGHAHRAPCSVIMTGAKPASSSSDSRTDNDRVIQAKLRDIQGGVIFTDVGQSDQVIGDLGQPDRCHRCGARSDEGKDLGGRRLVPQERDDGVGIEDRQLWAPVPFRPDGAPRRGSCGALGVASAWRDSRLARALSGPRPAYLPCMSDGEGSSLSGRMTTRSPRSTTATRSTFHRARAWAGIETWPLRDTVRM